MAIDWTVIPTPAGIVGPVEYRVENDGWVRLRGNGTLTAPGPVHIPIPPEAAAIWNPIYFDWTGAPTSRNAILSGGPGIYNNLQYASFNNPYDAATWPYHMTGTDLAHFGWQGTPPPPIVLEHTLENVIAGVADALRNIVGLRVYDFPSDRVEPPAAVLSRPETGYDVTLGGRSDEWAFPLWVLVAKADDKAAYAEMLPYLEAEGPKSIRAMLEADRTLGGACDTCAVVRARPLFATIAGTEFLAVEFTLEVYT